MSAVGRICFRCDRVIQAGGHEIPRDSMSGARPSSWAHDVRDPSCRPITDKQPR
ncbi:hypothetical protein [Streptomyces sp. H27-H5]|uniref:hypothetical protein n=1 Tax=Streptomyces sp. H27-H5 TaxID=2996460 RepID=UPI002270ABE2|nr:hypothetical protein [Streptomyces sp. H27-H5]MCY0961534.1 hypothetical protein [Streptomyces sp. H27-H5]